MYVVKTLKKSIAVHLCAYCGHMQLLIYTNDALVYCIRDFCILFICF